MDSSVSNILSNQVDPLFTLTELICEIMSMASELMVLQKTENFHAAVCKQFVGISLFLMMSQRFKKIEGLNSSNKTCLQTQITSSRVVEILGRPLLVLHGTGCPFW
ncbi:hypothetical protein TNCT_298731 [Trichonephila clavata]|uniref:Uncharacterized protein n=1 Tax=Trichonephila clavata TaxID=2740835 RepID=A0A8X6GKZ5_TRICU|nr:hypothetical protein TNCT_298731 [Trichonephila clavata]